MTEYQSCISFGNVAKIYWPANKLKEHLPQYVKVVMLFAVNWATWFQRV